MILLVNQIKRTAITYLNLSAIFHHYGLFHNSTFSRSVTCFLATVKIVQIHKLFSSKGLMDDLSLHLTVCLSLSVCKWSLLLPPHLCLTNASTFSVHSRVCPRLSRGSGLLCLFILAGPIRLISLLQTVLMLPYRCCRALGRVNKCSFSPQGLIPEIDVVATGGNF